MGGLSEPRPVLLARRRGLAVHTLDLRNSDARSLPRDSEPRLAQAAIDTALSRLPRAQVARVAPGDAAKAQAIATFLREEAA